MQLTPQGGLHPVVHRHVLHRQSYTPKCDGIAELRQRKTDRGVESKLCSLEELTENDINIMNELSLNLKRAETYSGYASAEKEKGML